MRLIPLFFTAMILAGAGAYAGMIAGSTIGLFGAFAGGLIGGVLVGFLAARIAVWRGWVPRDRYRQTALGSALGFLVAALAVLTASSPVVSVLSILLVGLGAVFGARLPR